MRFFAILDRIWIYASSQWILHGSLPATVKQHWSISFFSSSLVMTSSNRWPRLKFPTPNGRRSYNNTTSIKEANSFAGGSKDHALTCLRLAKILGSVLQKRCGRFCVRAWESESQVSISEADRDDHRTQDCTKRYLSRSNEEGKTENWETHFTNLLARKRRCV